MSDLVNRINLYRPSSGSLFESAQEMRELMAEAADRIEDLGLLVKDLDACPNCERMRQLEAALREIKEYYPHALNSGVYAIVQHALEGK